MPSKARFLPFCLLLFIISCFLGRTTHSWGTVVRTRTHDAGIHLQRRISRLHASNDDGGRKEGSSFRSLPQPELVRGERYKNENSTLPSPEIIAAKLGVKPTKEASAKTWQRAWKLHKRLIPLLHSTDGCKPPDSSLNLACMWWKGLSGNDKSSPVYDNELAYDLLPSGWRRILRLRRLYPRLHHGNVELRTAYLDGQIAQIVEEQKVANKKQPKIRLVCMGAGYDTRGIKMTERKLVDQVVELDLPEVVNAKERLFQRLLKRRPWLTEFTMPSLVPSNFNDVPDVEQKLRNSLLPNKDDEEDWYTIFVFEGVMIYLNDGVPSSMLNITSKLLRENNLNGSLCFADRLENVPGGDFEMGVEELKRNGWALKDWSPKPGVARHMGSASLSATT